MADQPTPPAPPATTTTPKASPSMPALTTTTLNAAKKVWATAFVRGALFLVIGLLMFLVPNIAFGLTKWLLIILFALQAVLFAVEASRQSKDDTDGQLWRYALAVAAIAVAVALLIWPSSTIGVVFKLVAVWALISGVLGVIAALRRMKARKPAWDWELTTSLLWVVFGLMVLLKPVSDDPAVAKAAAGAALSVYLTITGVVLLVAAWSLRVYKQDLVASADVSVAAAAGAGAAVAGSTAGVVPSAPTASAPTDPAPPDPPSEAVSPSALTAPLPAVKSDDTQQ